MRKREEKPFVDPFQELVEDLAESPADAELAAQGDQEPAAAETLLSEESARSWQELVATADQQARATDPIIQLVQEYKEAIKARDEAQDKYLRAAAEFANARRRAEVRADHEVRAARELILNSFLPVVDDLARALLAVPVADETQSWIEGFNLIQRKLDSVLQRQGVTAIKAEGQAFDPALHQAVLMEEIADVRSGTVVQELQKGYLLDGRVLRPAMVKVAQ